MAVVLDSTAVAGFLDRRDALHETAAALIKALLPTQSLFVSVVTYAEVLTGGGLGHHPPRAVRGFFEDVISEILPVDPGIAERAAELRVRRRSLRMPDAFILATSELHPDVESVVTGDAEWTRLRNLDLRIELLA
ncbi:MAG: type II toxin-antitoxin system VapC family toxin [Solirubrobacterales bacterium]